MPEVDVASGVVFGLAELIVVTYSRDTCHGLGGTEQVLSALRRFVAFGDSLARGRSILALLGRRASTANHVGSLGN
jgi:hypothetical protein